MITKKVIIYINGRNGLIILILELRKVYIFYNLFFASVASSIQAGAYENNSTVLKIFYRFVGELFFICHLATTPSLTSSPQLCSYSDTELSRQRNFTDFTAFSAFLLVASSASIVAYICGNHYLGWLGLISLGMTTEQCRWSWHCPRE